MKGLVIIQHPLVQNKLAKLRDKEISHTKFRQLTKELTGFMLYEVMKDFPLEEIDVETPLMTTKGQALAKEISIVVILRAGLGMVDGLLELVPTAKVGHIGLYRDEESHENTGLVTFLEEIQNRFPETEFFRLSALTQDT